MRRVDERQTLADEARLRLDTASIHRRTDKLTQIVRLCMCVYAYAYAYVCDNEHR